MMLDMCEVLRAASENPQQLFFENEKNVHKKSSFVAIGDI